jgi:basic amino acid/polyamine antiporter, APA family
MLGMCRVSGCAAGPARFAVVQYKIAGVLLAIGVVLWAVTVLVNKRTGGEVPRLDPSHLSGEGPKGPRN